MGSGTSTRLQMSVTPRLTILKRGIDGTLAPAVRRYVYCWAKENGAWKPGELLLTDLDGVLRVVEDDVRTEFTSRPKNPVYLHSQGAQSLVPNPAKHNFFVPRSKVEYFFAFLPVDLILRPEYCNNHDKIKSWAHRKTGLIEAPPKHWLEDAKSYGTQTIITTEILTNGLCVVTNWLEWLFEVGLILGRMNWYTAYAAARKQPYLKAVVLLDMIGMMLDGTATCAAGAESTESSKKRSREYALYHLETFSELIRKKHLSQIMFDKEQAAFLRFAQQILEILHHPQFKESFLRFVFMDRKCDGSLSSLNRFDPVHFMISERIDEIIRSALAAIVFDPSQMLARQFYEGSILPLELKLADTLEPDELAAIKDIFTDENFCNQYLSGCTASQKTILLSEIDNALQPLTTAGGLSALDKEIPGMKAALQDIDTQSALWNWFKDSSKDTVDSVLGTFLEMRESWATEVFKDPKLPNSMKTSIRRTMIAARTTAAAYKKYTRAGGTATGATAKSVKEYVRFIKGRMLDKNRWINNDDGKALGGTPANLNMFYSAIGVTVSIQGIYSFAQKCRSGSKPSIDDYIDLYKSLSSGVSSLIALMPDAVEESHLVKALSRVFVPLSSTCDIYASVKLIKKSQLYFAQGEVSSSLYTGIQASMKLGSAGFTLATLFRTKWLSKYLLKRQTLLAGGSKVLGFTLSFAMMGCEAFKWYLKAIEPQGSKIAKDQIIPELEALINEDPRKAADTVPVQVHGTSFNVAKINYFADDLKWKDSKKHNGTEIYCDPSLSWDWLRLRKLIKDEIAGVPPLLGLGWVTNFDKQKAMFELLERGVQVEAVGKIVGRKKEEVEDEYRNSIRNHCQSIADAKKAYTNDAQKKNAIIQALT